jgi:PEGA domain
MMNNAIARKAKKGGTIFLLMLGLAGCASIIHGTHQDVGITSEPAGASVTIDNLQSGITPVFAKLTRKNNHIVRIELPGYQPLDLTVTRSVSGWVWGNVAIGGLIGLAVDAISGGMYKLSPEQLSATLSASPTHASISRTDDGIYLFVVMKPQSNWEKVAQLQVR